MNYRVGSTFKPPFRVMTSVDDDSSSANKACITFKIRCDLPKDKGASALELEIPMPKSVVRTNCESPAKMQTWDWKEKTRTLSWKLKGLKGGEDAVLIVRATLDKDFTRGFRREVGPVNVKFNIPMYSASRIQLQYLHIARKDGGYNPQRWVRYATNSTSYVFRS